MRSRGHAPTAAGTTIVCLGDLVEDVVVAPAHPLRTGTDTASHIRRRRGGSAANVAVNVARAGGRARFVGAVGDDAIGRQMTSALRAEGVDATVRRRGRTGTVVVVVDAEGERSFYTDRGAATGLDRLPRGALADVAALHLPAYSLDGEPLASTARTAARLARRSGTSPLLSVDASSVAVLERIGPAAIDDLEADIVFLNPDEAAWYGNRRPSAGLVVEKGGGGPTVVYRAGEAPITVAAPRTVSWPDTTGAGDAFAAGFVAAIVGGSDPIAAVAAARRRAEHWLRSLDADDHLAP